MTTKELMQPFCATGDMRYWLDHIIKQGDYLYACDGHVLVAIKDDGTVETDPGISAGCPSDFEKVLRREICAGDGFIPLHFEQPAERFVCRACKGSGNIPGTKKCSSCDGDGEFDHYGHSYECKACDGDGKVDSILAELVDCEDCGGSGYSSFHPITLPDGRTFNLEYLNKLIALPGIEYLPQTNDGTGTFHTMHFRFDGGIGALMSVRV